MGEIINNTVLVHLYNPEIQEPAIKGWIEGKLSEMGERHEYSGNFEKHFIFGPIVYNDVKTVILITDGSKLGRSNQLFWERIRSEFITFCVSIKGPKEVLRVRHGEGEYQLSSYIAARSPDEVDSKG